MITYKEARYVAERVKGLDKGQALRNAGFSESIALNPQRIESPEVIQTLEAFRQELVTHALQCGLIDAAEIHDQLTDELRGDIAELYNPRSVNHPRFNDDFRAGELLPVELWPLWARQGGVEVLDEPNMVHSADGGEGSWDQVGRRIKVKMAPRHKAKELAMKHVAVKAFADQQVKVEQDVHITVTWQKPDEGQKLIEGERNVTPQLTDKAGDNT